MKPLLLTRLQADSFLATFGYIATPSALYRALQRNKEVQEVHRGLASGQVSEEMIRAFTSELLANVKEGQPFEFDVTVAAIAVALQARGSDFADEYLSHLARLQLTEMAMSIRVARECLKNRLNLAKTARGVTQVSMPDSLTAISYDELSSRYPRKGTGESRNQIVCGV